MSLLDWLPWRRGKRMLTLDQWMSLGLLEAPTAAGVSVSESNALTFGAYWSGVNLISTAVGKLPRKVYRKAADGSREELSAHPVAWILGANAMGVPGWPEFAFWTASIARVRTVLMQSCSIWVEDWPLPDAALWALTVTSGRRSALGSSVM